MAQSPSHRFGQIIGNVLESAIRPPLERIARETGLHLDAKKPRRARGGNKKVVWVDAKGNAHDLDYVFEEGGTEERIGAPKAFVEIAWRRYTKHSRNKAQEIQGAILPLAEKYRDFHPFLGVVLAGVFTDGSINQLRSHGFTVLYFPYQSVVEAFASAGIDADFDETTADSVLLRKVRRYERLSERKKDAIAAFLRDRHKSDLERFIESLRVTLSRRVESIFVLPLHGMRHTLSSISDAVTYIETFEESRSPSAFIRYEIGVRFTNEDEIRGQFKDKATAIAFLRVVH